MAKPTKQQKRAKKLQQKKKAIKTKVNLENQARNSEFKSNYAALTHITTDREQSLELSHKDYWNGCSNSAFSEFDPEGSENEVCAVHKLLKNLAEYFSQTYNIALMENDWVVEGYIPEGDGFKHVVNGPFKSRDDAMFFARETYPVKVFRRMLSGNTTEENPDYDELINSWSGDATLWKSLYYSMEDKYGYDLSPDELLECILDKIVEDCPEYSDLVNSDTDYEDIYDHIEQTYSGQYKQRLSTAIEIYEES